MAWINFARLFTIPPPKWKGVEFVSSKNFMRAYLTYEVNGKGYIERKHLNDFLKMLFAEGKCFKVDRRMMKDFKKSYVNIMNNDGKNRQWLSLYQLYTTLRSLFRYNFLLQYQGRRQYKLVDLLRIWRYYDPMGLGYIQGDGALVFAFDLLTEVKQKTNPQVIRALAHKLSVLSGGSNGNIEFSGMNEILPLEVDIRELFCMREQVGWDEFGFTFDIQDKKGTGSLAVEDVKILLKRLADKFVRDNPDNMEMKLQQQMVALATVARETDGVLYKEDLRALLATRTRKERQPIQTLQVVKDFNQDYP